MHSIYEKQEELRLKINKFKEKLKVTEYNMLMTLNNHSLLLDFTEEVDFMGNVRLVAYNLEREIIFIYINKR